MTIVSSIFNIIFAILLFGSAFIDIPTKRKINLILIGLAFIVINFI